MAQKATNREDQQQRVLQVLIQTHPSWVSGKVLLEASGGTVLSGRVAGLREEGWDIKTSDKEGPDGFFLYRLSSPTKGPPSGRKQLFLKLPPCPFQGGWNDIQAKALATAANAFLQAEASRLYGSPLPTGPMGPEEESLLDFLLGED